MDKLTQEMEEIKVKNDLLMKYYNENIEQFPILKNLYSEIKKEQDEKEKKLLKKKIVNELKELFKKIKDIT